MATREGLFYLQVHIPERLKIPLKTAAASSGLTLSRYVAAAVEVAIECTAETDKETAPTR